MTDEEMFEKQFERPKNYMQLSFREQWDIDKKLGLLDWQVKSITFEQEERMNKFYLK